MTKGMIGNTNVMNITAKFFQYSRSIIKGDWGQKDVHQYIPWTTVLQLNNTACSLACSWKDGLTNAREMVFCKTLAAKGSSTWWKQAKNSRNTFPPFCTFQVHNTSQKFIRTRSVCCIHWTLHIFQVLAALHPPFPDGQIWVQLRQHEYHLLALELAFNAFSIASDGPPAPAQKSTYVKCPARDPMALRRILATASVWYSF
jgi:hypothetical protein